MDDDVRWGRMVWGSGGDCKRGRVGGLMYYDCV